MEKEKMLEGRMKQELELENDENIRKTLSPTIDREKERKRQREEERERVKQLTNLKQIHFDSY